MKTIKMTINGKLESVLVGHETRWQVPDEETLSETLRERFNLTGTKHGCGQGACGCCTVLLNGEAVPACQVLTVNCDGADIVTIEGLGNPATGELDPIQSAFIDNYAFQCGYCTPGIIMALKGAMIKKPNLSRKEIEEALTGNMCRCISQYHVLNAAEDAVKRYAGKEV